MVNIIDVRWTKGRGRRKYSFTVHDVAKVCGISVHTVKKAQMKGLDLSNFKEMCDYIISKRTDG